MNKSFSTQLAELMQHRPVLHFVYGHGATAARIETKFKADAPADARQVKTSSAAKTHLTMRKDWSERFYRSIYEGGETEDNCR